MNFMLNKVIMEGTGTRAQLDFTNVAGKTGTSTGPKDAWFVGFTGKYVAAVWLGNDDNRAMSGGERGVTGGQFAAPLWHSFMTVAHTDMNIPTIPGLEPHPAQIAEQQRLAEQKRADIAAGIVSQQETTGPDGQKHTQSILSNQTRDTLKKLAQALRKAGGLPDPPAKSDPATAPGNGPAERSGRRGAARRKDAAARARGKTRQTRRSTKAHRRLTGASTGAPTGATAGPRPLR